MLAIKITDKKASPMLNNKIAYNNRWVDIKEDDLEVIEHLVESGRELLIKEDGKEIKGEDYFVEDKNDDEVSYEELFDGHYTKRINNIEDYTEDLEVVEEILDYAKENDQPDSVIADIKEYIEELE